MASVNHYGMTTNERFWNRVHKTDTCWLWTGGLNGNGYAQHRSGTNKQPVHRYAYEQLVGPIPPGLVLDHLCRVKRCVNPEHLEPVTNRENLLRGFGVNGVNARKTHCPQGHPYDEANTLWTRQGFRQCWTCHHAKDARRKQARHARRDAEAKGEL